MTIRECARQSSAFATLYDIYQNREKYLLEFKEQGGKVVGQMGADVPDEIIMAAGMLPVRVYADPDKELKYTEIYLERAFEPSIRATFEKVVDGTYAKLFDYLAVSHTSDFELRMWLYLREMRRSERQMNLPPVEFVDWLWARRRLYQEENKEVVKRFRETVEKWVAHPITDDEIKAAAAVCNDDRNALHQIAALRRAQKPRVNGSEAAVITGSSFFMDRAAHAKLVRQIALDVQGWPELEGHRVFVTGTAQESTDLYDAIEACGCVVVGEDHNWGDRAFDRDTRTDIDPVRAIVDRYMLRQISTCKAPVAERTKSLFNAVASCVADGVIFYLHEHDESASWDYPEQKKALEETGVKTVAFFRQQWPVSKNDNLSAELESFAASLKVGA